MFYSSFFIVDSIFFLLLSLLLSLAPFTTLHLERDTRTTEPGPDTDREMDDSSIRAAAAEKEEREEEKLKINL